MLKPTQRAHRCAALLAMAFSSWLPARAAEHSIEQLKWLSGCWSSENAEPGSGEQWMSIAGETLLGMSRTVQNGKTVAYEFMRIARSSDGRLAFFAQPSGKPAGSFALLRLSETEVVFENPQHEFPQRVGYRFEPPSRLRASIEGARNGVNRSIEYPMVRVRCDLQSSAPAVK